MQRNEQRGGIQLWLVFVDNLKLKARKHGTRDLLDFGTFTIEHEEPKETYSTCK